MIIHKYNYIEFLGNPPIAYSTFQDKMHIHCENKSMASMRSLGINESFNQILVFDAHSAHKACMKIIESLKKMEGGYKYVKPWETMQKLFAKKIEVSV